MKRLTLILAFLIAITITASAQTDKEGCKDHSLFSKMTSFYITECSENYNQLELRTSSSKTETREGELFTIVYYFNFDAGDKSKSSFQIIKNYENAVKDNSGEIIYKNTNSQDADVEATFHLVSKDKEYWVKVSNFGGTPNEVEHYTLYVLEMEPMKQEVQASEMLKALNKDGFIALYINFETGKADIKPDSQPTVDQIVKMLKDNADLKISVEGHTDNVGSDKSNQTLSENRAKSVMDAIVVQGIDKSRLSFKGWGASKPIADNRTEDGRSKNRRVEIVKV